MIDLAKEADVHAMRERLGGIRARIAAACSRAGRRPEDVTLVGVSKTFPLAALVAAQVAGLSDFGENKAQELGDKATALPNPDGAVRWHYIGHLQRNKAPVVVAHADVFHALDSVRLARRLDALLAEAGRVLPCFVQVNVSGEESKYGLAPDALPGFLDALAEAEHLEVIGLMTLAAPAADPETIRPQFRRLRRLAEAYPGNPRVALRGLSMGMSGDFEVAIEEGATHVRIGSAVFGSRGTEG